MRTVFFGTPDIAVPALQALAETTELVGVVCQPDRPSGRGLALHEPPVKVAARELGMEAHQPVKVKTGNLDAWLRERSPDVAVVLAYGRILPKAVLEAPRRGCMNLHASLLPRWRGAAPINWAIVHGDPETGISLMQMDEGLDTGPVYAMRSIRIGPEETAGELAERIAELAGVVVREDAARGFKIVPAPQDDRLAISTIGPDAHRLSRGRRYRQPGARMSPQPEYTRVRGSLRVPRPASPASRPPGGRGSRAALPGPPVRQWNSAAQPGQKSAGCRGSGQAVRCQPATLELNRGQDRRRHAIGATDCRITEFPRRIVAKQNSKLNNHRRRAQGLTLARRKNFPPSLHRDHGAHVPDGWKAGPTKTARSCCGMNECTSGNAGATGCR
jgi:hypothetical protein